MLVLFALNLCAADWTDRGEYELALAIRSEVAAVKRLTLLDQWKAKYPASPLRQERRELYLAAYVALSDTSRMLDVVKEMLVDRPDNAVGAYWCSVLVPATASDSKELWGSCEKSARLLLGAAGTSRDISLLARRAIGWIYWQREEYGKAETELKAYLREDPDNAEITGWLGAAMAAQKQPAKTVAAMWYLARAAAGRLPEAQKRQAAGMLETVYASYHGSTDGLDDVRAASAKSTAPPEGFNIESAEAVAARKLAEAQRALGEWPALRQRLEAPDGAEYFAAILRGKPVPKLKGTLTGFSPPVMPTELAIAITTPGVEEVMVRLSAPLAAPPTRGQVLEFESTGVSFNRDPFVLVVRAENEKITGW